MPKNIDLKIAELELNNDIWWLIRLQNEIADKIALWNNVHWNLLAQKKIWAAIKSVRDSLDSILSDYIFDDDVDDINSSNLM